MANPNSRDDLIQYALRRLGKPLITINVSNEQIDDRVDEAIQMFQEFHPDASERVFQSYELEEADITNEYVDLSDSNFLTISRVFPPSESLTAGMFDVRYQIRLNDPFTYKGTGGLSNFFITKSYLSLMENILEGETPVRFNRHIERLYLDTNWSDVFDPGDYIMIEGYKALSPVSYTSMYNDIFLKRYLTALIRYQWGQNLSKFDEIQLPGGVTLKGTDIKQEAKEELDQLTEEMHTTWGAPVEFIMG